MFVMTDYTCIPFLPETNLDKYIIPHEHLIEEYVEKGIMTDALVDIMLIKKLEEYEVK